MTVHELAGKPAPYSILANIPRLVSEYYTVRPDPTNPEECVSFGTSGHRGSSSRGNFNEAHILAISQAICDFRKIQNTNGPLFIGMDTHALSEPAHATALEVLSANGVEVMVDAAGGYTPTPVISHAVIRYNRERSSGLADGIVITPSHNPPEDGGFKYNPPHGGPADASETGWIEKRANEILAGGNREVRRVTYRKALKAGTTHLHDFISEYVKDLSSVVNMELIRSSGLKIGVDPMGGAGLAYWDPIRVEYGLDLTIVNPEVDPTFRFMTVDKDGKIRMDCSSPYAMASLISLKDNFDVAFGNDSDYDRHGIVTPVGGLMNPNHYLAVAISYLFAHRERWDDRAAVGKTLVSSSMIDRVAKHLGRELAEVPVGFKWFVDGLASGSYGFGGEESAGASFLRMNGEVWTTDKDGFVMDLLAAEILAESGLDPQAHYRKLEEMFGSPEYRRVDTPATRAQKDVLKELSPEQVTASELAGEPILEKLTRAQANNAPIGGLKVVCENCWFAARPSGTEEICKIYAESFRGTEHLTEVLRQAEEIVNSAFRAAGV